MAENTILIIDDENNEIFFIEKVLKAEKLNTLSANNAADALNIAQKNNIDLILLDISLPGIDGFEICKLLKSNPKTKDLPIIFITGHDTPDIVVKGLSMGAVDYIKKPFNIIELLLRINIQLKLYNTQRNLLQELEQKKLIETELDEKIKNNEIIIQKLYKSTEKLSETNQKLEESQQLYSFLTENSPFGIAYVKENKFVWVNKRFEQLFGYKSEKLQLLDFYSLFDNSVNLKEISEQISSKINTKQNVSFEALMKNKNEQKIEVSITGQIIDIDDSEKGSIWLYDDISSKKTIQETILLKEKYLEAISSIQFYLIVFEEEIQFETILENLKKPTQADRIYLYKNSKNSNNEVTTVLVEEITQNNIPSRKNNSEFNNYEFQKLLPRWYKILTREQTIKGNIEDFPPDETEFLKKNNIKSILLLPLIVNESLYGFIGFDYCSKTKYWLKEEISYLKSAASAVAFFEERKKNQLQLKESEERYRLLAENATDLISRLSSDFTILYISPAIKAILGYEPEAMINRSLFKLFHPDDINIVNDYHNKLLSSNQIINESFRLRNNEGNFIWMEASSKSLRNKKGEVVEFISITRDISERVKMEESLLNAKVQAESANRAKSVFLTTMSHEIRTPLNAVLGFSDLLYKQITNPTQKSYLESIRSSGSTLLKIINDILDLSKIESGKMDIQIHSVDLYAIVLDLSQIFDLITKQKNLDIKVEFSSEIPKFLYLDELRIRQILYNLMNNAIKFTEKGYIKIEVLCLKKNKSTVDIQLNVHDTGIGIKPESQIKIFNAFQQQDEQDARKYGGTGLGLAIIKRLAEIMNGTILLKSTVGKGSCFSIILRKVKISKTESDTEKEITDIEPVVFESAIILLVDDIVSNRDVVKGYLKEHNFMIIEAKNGVEAIDAALKYKPDLILMDYKMPIMDGIEATEILRAKPATKNTPIIAITASAYNTMKEQSKKLGFNGYLPKPVKQSVLISELTKYLKYKKVTTKLATETGSEVKLAVEVLEKMPEIIKKLENEPLKQWQNLQKRQPFNEVRQFANMVSEIGKTYNFDLLINYADEIKLALDSFDIEKMRNQLFRFNGMIEKLKK